MDDSIRAITFFKGEKRVVESEVGSKDPNEIIVVSGANWTLTNRSSGEIEKEGNCEIDGAVLLCFFGMDLVGRYELEITAHVGREEIKQRTLVVFT